MKTNVGEAQGTVRSPRPRAAVKRAERCTHSPRGAPSEKYINNESKVY